MPEAGTYSIKDWDKLYETAETRKLKSLPRILVPVKHDGKGYRRIMRQPNGMQIYGAWILLLQVAAKCPVRGILEDDDGPLTPEDLELKTDCPAEVFATAMEYLSRPEVGWLSTQVVISRSESGRTPGDSGRLPGDRPDMSGDGGKSSGAREEKRREENVNKEKEIPPPPPILNARPFGESEKLWRQAAAEISDLGVEKLDCLKAATNSGVRIEEIQAIVEYFREHANAKGWGPPALHDRIADAFPGQPPERGWPKPSAKAQRAAERVASSEQLQAGQSEAAKKKQVQEYEALESDVGKDLDSMPIEAVIQMAGDINPAMVRLIRNKGRPEGMGVRRPLLLEIKRRKESA